MSQGQIQLTGLPGPGSALQKARTVSNVAFRKHLEPEKTHGSKCPMASLSNNLTPSMNYERMCSWTKTARAQPNPASTQAEFELSYPWVINSLTIGLA